MPNQITVDPKSEKYNSLDEAAKACAALFPNEAGETAGVVFKNPDGQFLCSTTVPGSADHFEFRVGVPRGVSLGAILHSHPGKDAYGQVFSPDDIKMANQLKLPSYVRFLDANDTRVYRPGVTQTEKMPLPGNKFGAIVARGDPLADPTTAARLQIAQQLQEPK